MPLTVDQPSILLTDLQDRHLIFSLDRVDIELHAVPNAAMAWELINALLALDQKATTAIYPVLMGHFTNWQKMD